VVCGCINGGRGVGRVKLTASLNLLQLSTKLNFAAIAQLAERQFCKLNVESAILSGSL
jgi:hypothetical protein